MAHFAEISPEGLVLRVLVIDNADCTDADGNESEVIGVNFCVTNFGGARWVQTSYNHNFRHRYADVGGFYDEELDVFIPPKPFSKWILNQNLVWIPPVAYPEAEGVDYVWNDEDGVWAPL